METIQGSPEEEKENFEGDLIDETNPIVAPTDREETTKDCPEEGKLSEPLTSKENVNTVIKEVNLEYTEEEAHSNRFQAVETEPAKRMIRCNPALSVGEKPSPSKTAVATPVPNFKDEEEQSFLSPSTQEEALRMEVKLTPEREEVLRVMRDNQHLKIMRQNGSKERSNLSPSSKDDTLYTNR